MGAPPPIPVVEAPSPLDKASSPVVGAPPKLVYNADLAPQLPRNPSAPKKPVLQVGVKTILRFDLGPQWEKSLIPGAEPAISIRTSTVDLPLTVVLGCDLCAPDPGFKQHMTFRPRAGRSEEIRFEFTPQRRKDGAGYSDKLHLLVINDKTGRAADQLTIPVTVVGEKQMFAPGSAGSQPIAFHVSAAPAGDLQPDVVLYAIEAKGREINISVEPVSDRMKALLGPLALDARGKPKEFRSGVMDPDDVDQLSNWAYESLAVLNLPEVDLQRLRETGVDAVISNDAREKLVMSKRELADVSKTIAMTGRRLYQTFFFNNADKGLAKLIALLENAAGNSARPLRIKIVTDRLSLPWQYLHPVGGPIDPKRFWGMRFSLSVQRANNGAQSWREAKVPDSTHKVLFARYGTSSDATVAMALKQSEKLKLALPHTEIVPIYSGRDLLSNLRAQKDKITGFVTFLHASAGDQHGVPQLQFGGADNVSSVHLDDLRSELDPADQDLRYLSLAPLVILNACETGPALKLAHRKLENSMFFLGAKGVIVTEVSVWQSLGNEVGTMLIDRLARGEAAGDALTEVRLQLLAEKNNPLGLLYAYYGDPAATLVP